MWGRRSNEASERFAERRQREDSAPRLQVSVPALESLKLEIRETTSSTSSSSCPEAAHIRRIVVEHAPALFFVMCHDSYCKDGGHDLSHGVLHALRQQKTHFVGEDRCNGRVGSADCQRILHYVGTATYRPSDAK
jgi:hypothetical protein